MFPVLALWAALLGQASAAPLIITNLVLELGGAPRLTIHADVGSVNRVEYSTNLSLPTWLELTNLTVTASPYTVLDLTSPPALRRFYRVSASAPATMQPTNMALIPAGAFQMGDALDGISDAPVHTVTLSAYYMDKYPVTKGLWDAVYAWGVAHGYAFENSGSVLFGVSHSKGVNHPVHSIYWWDAVKWCNARSEMEGRVPAYYTDLGQTEVFRQGRVENYDNDYVKWNAGYRLPTEAEWEKAARGGTSGLRFPHGNTISHSQANYLGYPATIPGGYAYDLAPEGFHPAYNDGTFPYTSPVGSFVQNGYGLFDMAGNIWQWCWDRFAIDSYSTLPTTDPHGPGGPSFSIPYYHRVIRGASWTDPAPLCRVASRLYVDDITRDNITGFRCVLPPNP
jgi:formylglycine-generating enzyme required for sulfatase activity